MALQRTAAPLVRSERGGNLDAPFALYHTCRLRLEEVKKTLDKFTDTKVTVSACGNWVWGPECSHLAVYNVSLLRMDAPAEKFVVMALTVSLPAYKGCHIIPEEGVDVMIYSSVSGPASEADCLQWIANNCGK